MAFASVWNESATLARVMVINNKIIVTTNGNNNYNKISNRLTTEYWCKW